jgi:hypothetical protein
MTATTKALVQRTGRKQHWATLIAGESAWIPVCDVADVPVFGAVQTAPGDWHAWISAAEADVARLLGGERPVLCSRCRTALLAAGKALAEVEGIRARTVDVEALQAEVRTLRAEVSRWTTAALAETRKHAEFVRERVTFRRAAR